MDGDLEGVAAVGAWTLAGAQCQASLTDGQVRRTDLVRHFLNADIADRLARRLVAVGLWHAAGHDCSQCPQVEDPVGWVFHDWFQLRYDTGAQVKESRRKRQELKDQALLNALWARDCVSPSDPTTAKCRYCGHIVKRADRKSDRRPVPDHVDPTIAKGVRNLVLACWVCNQQKGRRTPAQAGMQLRPPPRSTVDDPTSSPTGSRASSPPPGDAGRHAGTPDPPSAPPAGSPRASSPPHGDAGRPVGARPGQDGVSPPPGDAGTPQGPPRAQGDAPGRPPQDQIPDQPDPDLISAGLVRGRGHARAAGSGRGSSMGESPQGQAGSREASDGRARRRRRRRGQGKKTQPPTPPTTDHLDAGDYPVEDPPGQFGSPWHNWRGRPPEDDQAYCEAHGHHYPCRSCQEGVS